MFARIFLLLCALPCLLRGVEFSVGNLDLPLFDASGRLVRRLTAASATGSLDVPVLKTGTVEFFGADGAEPGKIGTLSFADATYHKSAGVIESDGPMQLRFAKGTIAAVGFRYELLTGQLILRSAVVLDFPEAHTTGREGEVFLTQNKADRDMLVSSAVIRGDVTITEIKVSEIKADRVETTSASYTGSDETLRPASPLTTWTEGKKGQLSGEMKLRLGRHPQPGSTPAAVAPVKK